MATSISDEQLQMHQDQQHEISVFVITGVKMEGRIIKFDQDSLILTSKFPEGVLIERKTVVTVMRKSESPHHQQQHQAKERGTHGAYHSR